MTKCSIKTCLRKSHARGWCQDHYGNWQRNGDPIAVGRVSYFGVACSECDKEAKVRGLCATHYSRWQRHGDPEINASRKPDNAIGYHAAHDRVVQARGKASIHYCVDCCVRASEWSYREGSSWRLLDTKGRPYSPDPADYDPRCVPCHRWIDSASRSAL